MFLASENGAGVAAENGATLGSVARVLNSRQGLGRFV